MNIYFLAISPRNYLTCFILAEPPLSGDAAAAKNGRRSGESKQSLGSNKPASGSTLATRQSARKALQELKAAAGVPVQVLAKKIVAKPVTISARKMVRVQTSTIKSTVPRRRLITRNAPYVPLNVRRKISQTATSIDKQKSNLQDKLLQEVDNQAEMGDSAHTKRGEDNADLTILSMGNKDTNVAGSSQDSSETMMYSMLINRVLSGQASSQDLQEVSGIQKALTRILSSTKNVSSTVTSVSDNHQVIPSHNETQSMNSLPFGPVHAHNLHQVGPAAVSTPTNSSSQVQSTIYQTQPINPLQIQNHPSQIINPPSISTQLQGKNIGEDLSTLQAAGEVQSLLPPMVVNSHHLGNSRGNYGMKNQQGQFTSKRTSRRIQQTEYETKKMKQTIQELKQVNSDKMVFNFFLLR